MYLVMLRVIAVRVGHFREKDDIYINADLEEIVECSGIYGITRASYPLRIARIDDIPRPELDLPEISQT